MRMPGVYSTQVGYAGGSIENPTYGDVCTGATNHNEVVRAPASVRLSSPQTDSVRVAQSALSKSLGDV